MKFTLSAVVVPLLFSGVLAAPYPTGDATKVVANIDPTKSSKTAEKIEQNVQGYGADTIGTTAGEVDDEETKGDLQTAAINGTNPDEGMETDEEPPAAIKTPGGPISTKATTQKEGQRK